MSAACSSFQQAKLLFNQFKPVLGRRVLKPELAQAMLLRSLFSLGTDALMTDNTEGRHREGRSMCGFPRGPTTARPLCSQHAGLCPRPHPQEGAQGTEQARVSPASVTMQWALVSLGSLNAHAVLVSLG